MLSHEPIEWPDEVELLVDRLESESAERVLSREERALMDVLGDRATAGEPDGFQGFWQSGVNGQRGIASAELVAATTLVDPLKAAGGARPVRRTATSTVGPGRDTSRPNV